MNILILEDDHTECSLFAEIAKGLFDTVDCVGSIGDLESRQWSKMFGVIIADLNLIDSRGVSTLMYVRNKFGRLPWILVVTGDEDIASGTLHENGADCVVRKRDLSVARFKAELIEAKQASELRFMASKQPTATVIPSTKKEEDALSRVIRFITNWRIIAGFIASTGILAAAHQFAYNILGKPMVQQQIDQSIAPLIRSDSIQSFQIRKNAEYGIKGYLIQKHTVSDSILAAVEKEYQDLFGR